MKKEVSFILLGLGLACGSTYAGTVSEPLPVSNDINLTAPDQSGMWSFGAEAVLMQPTNKAFNYADDVNSSLTSSPGTANLDIIGNHHNVDEGYYWWFGADIRYSFPGNGRDVTLAYEGLHGSSTDSTVDPGSGGVSALTNSLLISDFTGLRYDTAEGKTNTAYDAGDLLFGQKIDVGQRIRLHPFAGLRYAHIDVNETGKYYSADGSFLANGQPFTEDSKLENEFNGIGPRLGSDAQVNLGQGFSIRARLGLSALIGSRSIDNDTHIQLGINTTDVTVYGADKNESETRVIPEIDGRLGLNYTYNFDSKTALGFEAGWQATNYFNVITDQYPVTAGLANTDGIASSVGNQHYDSTSNFGLQGPYARVQLDIA